MSATFCTFLPGGGATRLARATRPQTAGNLQPGQMRSIASGNVCHVLHVSPGGGATRLARATRPQMAGNL
ncbi:hypothetical protein FML32_03045 [Klebsiella oxytoca]|nr:hypothetical protein [Klebsiella oxytoca]MBZ7719953.1 hypothetical protein [Klebsiella oxytoca]HAU6242898.1 hypothetical protein [Klebsiella oxytoca]HAU6248921.1 hypothetical protein [Klebsiella oxytoca]HAU6255482.1 hypothetical protein [Klebsiella oxytoca]